MAQHIHFIHLVGPLISYYKDSTSKYIDVSGNVHVDLLKIVPMNMGRLVEGSLKFHA